MCLFGLFKSRGESSQDKPSLLPGAHAKKCNSLVATNQWGNLTKKYKGKCSEDSRPPTLLNKIVKVIVLTFVLIKKYKCSVCSEVSKQTLTLIHHKLYANGLGGFSGKSIMSNLVIMKPTASTGEQD